MTDELPSYAALRYTVLEGLQKTGGPATNEQIDTWVKESPALALSQSALGLRHKGGRMSEIEYRAAWSRTNLKRSGLIDWAGRGLWQISPSGRQVSSIEALKEFEKEARRGRRQHRGSEAREETWVDRTLEILRASTDPISTRELVRGMMERYPEALEDKRRNSSQDLSTDAALTAQLGSEVSSKLKQLQRRYPGNVRQSAEGRPRRWWWTDGEGSGAGTRDSNQTTTVQSEASADVADRARQRQSPAERQVGDQGEDETVPESESELYPLLVDWLRSQGVHARRIDERRQRATRGSGANQRRWPDIVGYEDRTRELDGDVKHLASTLGANATRLWSVEVKLDLDIHNVRDAYYQTMMNSGWANVAYLAAWQISPAAEEEARELWERQGVGLIHIGAGKPGKSRILIHAREREGLDWRAVDRLTRENEDFRRFVRDVR